MWKLPAKAAAAVRQKRQMLRSSSAAHAGISNCLILVPSSTNATPRPHQLPSPSSSPPTHPESQALKSNPIHQILPPYPLGTVAGVEKDKRCVKLEKCSRNLGLGLSPGLWDGQGGQRPNVGFDAQSNVRWMSYEGGSTPSDGEGTTGNGGKGAVEVEGREEQNGGAAGKGGGGEAKVGEVDAVEVGAEASGEFGGDIGGEGPGEVLEEEEEEVGRRGRMRKSQKFHKYGMDIEEEVDEYFVSPPSGEFTHLYDTRGIVEKWLGHPTLWGMLAADIPVEKKEKEEDETGPELRWETRMILAPGEDAWHPANRKVKVSVYVRELGLSPLARSRLVALVGRRYNPNKDELSLVSERFQYREENRKDVLRTLIDLIKEAKKADELAASGTNALKQNC